MSNPDWRTLALAQGVLREQTPDARQLVLWLPEQPQQAAGLWQRISNLPGVPFATRQGLCAVPATAIRVVQQAHGWVGKLSLHFRKPADKPTWLLPNGQTAEQVGERQTDLLLVWSDNVSLPADATRIKACWPLSTGSQRLANNLFLVAGVPAEPTDTEVALVPGPGSACKQARQLLEAAREAGNRRAEVSALTDLGAVTLDGGDAPNALVVLHAALKLARQFGDQAAEADVLFNLGKAARAARQPARALECLSQALTLARVAGDRFAAKLSLDQLGSLHAAQRDLGRAIAAYEQALALARAVGHRAHEADLLWTLAIHNAELGRHDQAVALAQAALDLFTELGHPHVALLADHLQRYQDDGPGHAFFWSAEPAVVGSAATVPAYASLTDPASAQPGPWSAPAPAVSGPGLLRMAYCAAKSMARFVGSGMKTVAPVTQQQRLQTCARCEHHTGVRCKLCCCFTSVKTRLPHETCPLGKWPA